MGKWMDIQKNMVSKPMFMAVQKSERYYFPLPDRPADSVCMGVFIWRDERIHYNSRTGEAFAYWTEQVQIGR